MDTGFLQPGETMEDDYDVGRELTPAECLGIMDQILCLEVRVSDCIRQADAKQCALDGMAHGAPLIPNSIHEHVY